MNNQFISELSPKPVHLTLVQDRVRSLKRGYPWVFAHSLAQLPAAKPGSMALLKDREGVILAKGMYDPECQLAFRVCVLGKEYLNDEVVLARLEQAVQWRRTLFAGSETTAYRLINGEGDRLPGLVCDIYGETAVVQLDGDGPRGFWEVQAIGEWLYHKLSLRSVYFKPRSREESEGRMLVGEPVGDEIQFKENGNLFHVNVISGQKSGFFLDQRDNRRRLGELCDGKTVLNLFGYTGGFSIYAGKAGATEVLTVDLAKPAVEAACKNWTLNGLLEERHKGIAANVFPYLEEASSRGDRWDVVIVDPPSFAASKEVLEKAVASYTSLIASSVSVVKAGGILAASSCSSHITPQAFLEICEEAISKVRRRGTVLGVYGQPEDHPFPIVCKELQYLKFVLIRIE